MPKYRLLSEDSTQPEKRFLVVGRAGPLEVEGFGPTEPAAEEQASDNMLREMAHPVRSNEQTPDPSKKADQTTESVNTTATSILLQWSKQKKLPLPECRILSVDSTQPETPFLAICLAGQPTQVTWGTGRTKQEAENHAADHMFRRLAQPAKKAATAKKAAKTTAKLILRQWSKQRNLPSPDYRILNEDITQPEKRFLAACRAGQPAQETQGIGRTKLAAEREAADLMLRNLSDPIKSAGPTPVSAKKAIPAKKTTSVKKATPAKRTAPAKKATPAKKAAPVKKTTPIKKTDQQDAQSSAASRSEHAPGVFAGYRFRNLELYQQALTHSSHGAKNYERLEFLGDAVLDLIISRFLFETFTNADPGELSRRRSLLVCHPTLARLAHGEGLIQKMRRGPGFQKPVSDSKVHSDVFEAMLAAVYLDSDIDVCDRLMRALYERYDLLPKKGEKEPLTTLSPKTVLQEWLQKARMPLPVYKVVQKDIDQERFLVVCRAGQPELERNGIGRTKQEAEQQAANTMFKALAGFWPTALPTEDASDKAGKSAGS